MINKTDIEMLIVSLSAMPLALLLVFIASELSK